MPAEEKYALVRKEEVALVRKDPHNYVKLIRFIYYYLYFLNSLLRKQAKLIVIKFYYIVRSSN